MKNGLLVLCLIIVAAAIGMPLLEGLIGAVVGIAIAPVAAIGGLLLAGFIVLIVFSSLGVVGLAVMGVVGAVLLAVAVPLLFPLFIVIIPVALLLKLASKI
ncbi:hypothetical protein JW948_00660 [bacterium]|nr:hypothetical protein [bacterium]